MTRAAQNRRSHARRKERQSAGIPGCALPDELAEVFSDNQTTDEQEARAHELLYGLGGITFAILEHRKALGQRTREDVRRPLDIREFGFDRQDFSYRARTA